MENWRKCAEPRIFAAEDNSRRTKESTDKLQLEVKF